MSANRFPTALFCCLISISSAPALEWKQEKGFRVAVAAVSPSGKAGFTLMSPTVTGVGFTNDLPMARYQTNQILLNGSGVAAGDVDGDGWCDLFFCRLNGPNALYRNLGGWKFQDVTVSAGLARRIHDASGGALADLDGDSDMDLIVNSVGAGTHIFFNDGRGHFAEGAVVNPGGGGTSVALGDLDGDGFLDVYIANYRPQALMDMPNARFWMKPIGGRQVVTSVDGRPVTEPDLADRFIVNERGGIEELGQPDVLLRNLGGTNFVPVSFTGGAFLDEQGGAMTKPQFDWGLAVMIRDLNQDGLPDVYVCNDFDSPDRIWINQGAGRFRLIAPASVRKGSRFSMGVDFADFNRDGHDDFFVLDMLSREQAVRINQMPDRKPPIPVVGQSDNRPEYMLNTLFLNRGDGTYAEIGQLAGVHASEWSWTPVFLDVDLDGWEDLLISNGQERASRDIDVSERMRALRTSREMTAAEILDARKMFPRFASANVAFRNRRDLTFEDASKAWGFDFFGVSNGMALADLDNDGDLDVVVNNLNDMACLYRNDSPAPRVAVRLKGRAPNTTGIGARITVTGGPVAQSQEMISGGRYLSSDAPARTFAAGALTNLLTIEVTWRGGRRSVITGARPNRIYEVDEAAADDRGPNPAPGRPQRPPLFQDVSSLLGHTHTEEPFDDYARQPLLPNNLSQLGPGVTWSDLDGDGWDELIVAGGKGGRMGVFRNDGKGGFTRWSGSPFAQVLTRDQTTVLPWRKPSGQMALLAGSSNYEDGLDAGSCVRQFDLETRRIEDNLPGHESSTGPLALADVDGDGDLDLFVGGRCLPGKYPEAASSMLFRSAGGKFEVDAENTRRLAGIGLVSGAVFSDLDGDGDGDLALACDWGPLKIFRNEQGRLIAWDAPVQLGLSPLTPLSSLTGWWNGVTTGDFDGDGRLDLVASNWGRNTRYECHRSQPLQILHGDLDGDGSVDLVETFFDARTNRRVPERSLDFMAKGLPFLRVSFSSHRKYGESGVEEILGERLKGARKLEANWLESTVFLNRGDFFDAKPLPVEAQFAPAFGVGVGDYDGDGNEDIFLAQNFFCAQPETPRYDGGRGLWLRGDGRGGFSTVAGQESGVQIYGEQRGCALSDFDGDGRVDLAVAQNGAATKLYKNMSGRPGLRVRLSGPAGNPHGVGATVRMGDDGRLGPAREIHAGAGYWSHDSSVQVMSVSGTPSQLWVRWPGGLVMRAAIPAGAREVGVAPGGEVQRLR